MNNYLQDIWYHRLLGVSIILAFLLPHSMTPFLLVNPILCVCLYFFGGGMPRLSVKYFPLFFIAIALFVSSIIASLSFLQNNNNKTKNYALESCQEAQNKTANIKAQDDLIQAKKAEIATLNTSLKNLEKTSKDSIKDLRNRYFDF